VRGAVVPHDNPRHRTVTGVTVSLILLIAQNLKRASHPISQASDTFSGGAFKLSQQSDYFDALVLRYRMPCHFRGNRHANSRYPNEVAGDR
jgi:hypothetical protein